MSFRIFSEYGLTEYMPNKTNSRPTDSARRSIRQTLDAFFEKTFVKCYVRNFNFTNASKNSV